MIFKIPSRAIFLWFYKNITISSVPTMYPALSGILHSLSLMLTKTLTLQILSSPFYLNSPLNNSVKTTQLVMSIIGIQNRSIKLQSWCSLQFVILPVHTKFYGTNSSLILIYFTISHSRKQFKKYQELKGSHSRSLAPLHVNRLTLASWAFFVLPNPLDKLNPILKWKPE